MEGEQKPNPVAAADGNTINLKVKSSDGSEVFFKVKKSTPFLKLFNAYCQKQGQSSDAVAFLYDGQRLKGDDTPSSLDMEDDDVIDVVLHQIGGATH